VNQLSAKTCPLQHRDQRWHFCLQTEALTNDEAAERADFVLSLLCAESAINDYLDAVSMAQIRGTNGAHGLSRRLQQPHVPTPPQLTPDTPKLPRRPSRVAGQLRSSRTQELATADM